MIDDFEAFMAEVRAKNGQADWTDAQWAEHDAKIEADKRARETAERLAEERSAVGNLVDKCGWPVRAIEAAEAADLTKPAIAKVLDWDYKSQNVLVLSGPPGCGKTTAAAAWAMRRAKANVGRSWSFADSLGWGMTLFLRATTFAGGSRYDEQARARWSKAEALVFDDLGAEYADSKGNFLVDLDELVDTFYGDKKPLIVTTNCTSAEFKKRYGQRVVDRFRECGTWFEIAGASLRRKA